MGEYGKEKGAEYLCGYAGQRLQKYAQSFRDLAFHFTRYKKEEPEPLENRGAVFFRAREAENWERLGERFDDVAVLLDSIALERYSHKPLPAALHAKLSLMLKKRGVILKSGGIVYHPGGRREYVLFLVTPGRGLVATEDVSNLLSEVLRKRIIAKRDASLFIGNKEDSYVFVEEPPLKINVAKAYISKEKENISGDSFSFFENDNGMFYVLLSDGTGSGARAGRESGRMVDLAEKYLEAGFARNQMIGIVEGMHLGNGMENRMPTLDLCEINCYTGECVFCKYGSAPGFIWGDKSQERMDAKNLLPGFESAEKRQETKRLLSAGERIVMMTDGVAEKIADHMDRLREEYEASKEGNHPKYLANFLLEAALKESEGIAADDMTVLICEIQRNL